MMTYLEVCAAAQQIYFYGLECVLEVEPNPKYLVEKTTRFILVKEESELPIIIRCWENLPFEVEGVSVDKMLAKYDGRLRGCIWVREEGPAKLTQALIELAQRDGVLKDG